MMQSSLKSVFGVVVLGSLLVACQPASNQAHDSEGSASETKTQPEQPVLQGRIAPIQIDLPDCSGNSCPSFRVERLQSNFPEIDQIIDQAIVSSLSQTVDISELNATGDKQAASSEPNETSGVAANEGAPISPEQALQKEVVPYVQAFLKLDRELKALSATQKISVLVRPAILKSSQPVATVVLNTSSYLGGAHGASSQQYYNFDLASKKQIHLNDILLAQQKSKLHEKAYAIFKAWVKETNMTEDIQAYEQAWAFKLTDNFLLGRQGLILQYGEYEIGPYAVGMPRLVIPYADLDGILKPEYMPQPNAPEPAQAPEQP